MIRIERITDGIEDEIDRLANGPTDQDLLQFEIVLAQQFQATQRAVHVITRSLKNSGKVKSSIRGNTWEGIISYGGRSEDSIHNPVDYAEYERERDGSHDFLAPAIGLGDGYVAAIYQFLEG